MRAGRSARPRVFTWSLALALALAAGLPARARADGAFPDAQNLLMPADWPNETILATTFGVVFSQDGGSTWLWTCEQDKNALGLMYQISLPPRHRVYALANQNLIYSDDLTCSWRIAGGGVTGQEIADVWVDRAVPDRVFVVGTRCCEGGQAVRSVFLSIDGGQSFGAAAYVGAPGDIITGVETSISDPSVAYLTVQVGGNRPLLLRSADEGATWQPRDLSVLLGPGSLRLIAVDPGNPDRVFLMWRDIRLGEQLVLTEDGGQSVTIPFPGTGDGRVLSAWGRTPSGALLLATDTNGVGGLFRSTDGGHTFQKVTNPPALRGFAVRGGVLYGGTNNFADGYAIGASTDDGDTWTPVLRYDQVQAIPACLRDACGANCRLLAPKLWTPDVCTADATPPPDAGPGPGGVRAGGGGCGCTVAATSGGRHGRWWGLILTVLMTLAAVLGAARRRRGHRPGETPRCGVWTSD